ncbi:MAG: NADH-quinone oxidoreductase subunit M [Bacteroidota bacterium]
MLTLFLFILPLIFTLVLFAIPNVKHIKSIAFVASIVEFAIAVIILFQFLYGCHCVLNFHPDVYFWLGINLNLNMDGLSLLLILLTTFLCPIIIFSTFNKDSKKPAAFYALILLMEMSLIGVFTASDVLLFYIFWELALIPVYFITALWGGENARKITLEFLIYTLVGSLLMLAAIVYLYTLTPGQHSFSFNAFYALAIETKAQVYVFLAFFLAFAIKIPLFPFHSWQPKTYTVAPTQGSMLLAGLILKMGIYGLLRFVLPLCSDTLSTWNFYAILLSIIGIIYASVIAIRQNELKRLIAFASLAHVGLIAAGVFSQTFWGIQGAIMQMLSHGVNVVGLFFCYEIIVRRTQTGNMTLLGGIASKAPVFSAFFMIIVLATIALPLTNSFVGEFLMLLGIFQYNPYLALIAGLTVVFSAIYMLQVFQRIMLGSTKPATENFIDMSMSEIMVLVPIVILIFWMGIYPKMFLNIAEPIVKGILNLQNITQ